MQGVLKEGRGKALLILLHSFVPTFHGSWTCLDVSQLTWTCLALPGRILLYLDASYPTWTRLALYLQLLVALSSSSWSCLAWTRLTLSLPAGHVLPGHSRPLLFWLDTSYLDTSRPLLFWLDTSCLASHLDTSYLDASYLDTSRLDMSYLDTSYLDVFIKVF